MSKIYWPASLPQHPLEANYSKKRKNNRAKFQPEIGPSIDRPRSTLKMSDVTMSFHMKRCDIGVFETFFEVALKEGALAFYMNDPLHNIETKYKFGDEDYSISKIGFDLYLVDMTLQEIRT